MEDNVRRFLTKIANVFIEDIDKLDELKGEAENLLAEDFKNRVIDTWKYSVVDGYDAAEYQKLIKNNDVIEFIAHCKYSEGQKNFLANHLNRITEIMQILQDFVKNHMTEEGE